MKLESLDSNSALQTPNPCYFLVPGDQPALQVLPHRYPNMHFPTQCNRAHTWSSPEPRSLQAAVGNHIGGQGHLAKDSWGAVSQSQHCPFSPCIHGIPTLRPRCLEFAPTPGISTFAPHVHTPSHLSGAYKIPAFYWPVANTSPSASIAPHPPDVLPGHWWLDEGPHSEPKSWRAHTVPRIAP